MQAKLGTLAKNMNKLISKGKEILLSEQSSILSAATLIMGMTITSQILGLVRQRVVLHFFVPDQSSLFFAALRLPELLFEVLVYGMFSSAFIPIFTKAFKKNEKEAWETSGKIVTIGLLIFLAFAVVFGIFAEQIYTFVAPGYNVEQIKTIVLLARVLFFAQGIFIVSYVLTSVLESLRRFLVPALAPVFYNLGLIAGTYFLAPRFGIAAPAIGVVIGALVHFLIQLPLSIKLGFRFTGNIKPNTEVKEIARLAAPRLLDLSVQQVVDMTVLYFASIISTASYTYFTLANSLQIAPVRLFGTSLAKAALPTLTRESDSAANFSKTLLKTLHQMLFLIIPVATLFIVLRIPMIRIFFGTSIFDWNSTVSTGMVLSAFAIGIPFQATVPLLARAFYALHDTKTPVVISVVGDILIIATNFILIGFLRLPVWSLGAAFSLGAAVETIILSVAMSKRMGVFSKPGAFVPLLKILFSSSASGAVMFMLLKFFDRWAFIGGTPLKGPILFESFVLDTRYTVNLIILTALVALAGIIVYLLSSLVLKSEELTSLVSLAFKHRFSLNKLKKEPIAPVETLDNG